MTAGARDALLSSIDSEVTAAKGDLNATQIYMQNYARSQYGNNKDFAEINALYNSLFDMLLTAEYQAAQFRSKLKNQIPYNTCV